MLVKWSEQETELGVIGRVGENNTRKIEIDCAETLEKLPGAEIICVMLRPGDETPYTMPLEANGNKRTIVMTDTDLERRGTIRLELRAVEDGAVLKSAILRGTVADSIRGEGDAPGQPVRDVLDRVDDTLKAAEATRKELETALGGVQGAVDAATGAAGAATEAAAAAEETDAQIEQGRVAAEKKREHATAAAVKSITDTVEDVQNKLESGAFDGKDGKDAPQIDDTTISDAAPWSSQHIVDMLCPPLEASGNPVVCYPVVGSTLGVTASWEPTQEGAGTPSPDNIRPIHGRTQVKVERCGENLLPYIWDRIPDTATRDGLTIVKTSEGTIHVTGTKTGTNWTDIFRISLASSEFFELPAGTYSWGVYMSLQSNYGNMHSSPFTIDTPRIITGAYIAVNVPGTYNKDYVPALVAGSELPTKVEPYQSESKVLTLPREIYGADLQSDGEGQETWRILNLGTANISLYGINDNGITSFSLVTKENNFNTTSGTEDFISSSLQRDTAAFAEATRAGIMKANASTFYIRLKQSDAQNVEQAKAYLSSINAKIAYKLATPTPFAATGGGTVKALASVNTILTDADALTITGRADPIHIIQQLQATSAASAQALEDDTMEITQEEAIQEENEKGMNG